MWVVAVRHEGHDLGYLRSQSWSSLVNKCIKFIQPKCTISNYYVSIDKEEASSGSRRREWQDDGGAVPAREGPTNEQVIFGNVSTDSIIPSSFRMQLA